jgi:RNA polymerase sigma-70 factor (ECF subfamily)
VELDDVFRAHQREILAYFQRVVGNRADAEELAQETFVRACSAALRYRGEAPIRAWLFGIARRVLLEAARAGLFDRRGAVPDLPEPLVDHEERMDLERAFASLEVIDREALMFVDVLGFTPTEAAGVVDIAPEAFRMRLYRARGRLRERYGDG